LVIVTDEVGPQKTPPLDIPAEFAVIVQLIRVSKEFSVQHNPPPSPVGNTVPVAEFPLIVQSVIVMDELSTQYTPPPSVAELPVIVQSVRVRDAPNPPTAPPPEFSDEFSTMVQSIKIGEHG
jgi:hypothetical protein